MEDLEAPDDTGVPTAAVRGPTAEVRCQRCENLLLHFEKLGRALTTMRSFGTEVRQRIGDARHAHAECERCGALTAFDRRLLPGGGSAGGAAA